MTDFPHPGRRAEGIGETWVNGQAAYAGGRGATAARAGRLVTRQG